VEESIQTGWNIRQPEWTETIAVGSEKFVQDILGKLAPRVPGRKVRELTDHYELRKQGEIYNAHFRPENAVLSIENVFHLSLKD
jgi:putative transposase